ncbi:IS66 family transposase [Bacillus weihaiensis]|uniref:IS66 family transposase n=1 Tax=Bacillus weihaiensis TaxID=1547283 RepID=UPI0023566FDD|nr:IS66 family transposase [Bacillus weihaiensis]
MKKTKKTSTTTPTIEELLERVQLLEQKNADLEAKLEKEKYESEAKINWLQEQLRLHQSKRFGVSSEKGIPGQLKQTLFNEVEKEANLELPEPTVETITYRRKKKRGQRQMMLENLPEETIEYRLSDEEQVCSCCGGNLHEMSTEVRQELKYIPAEVKVVKHVRHVYSCRHCEQEAIETPIQTASMPKPVISGSLASPSMLAHIMSQKYVEGLPIYRQEKHLHRLGLTLSRQTMANWMVYGADRWLSKLYRRMHQLLVKLDIICADETTLQVLKEPGRSASSKSYLWLYRTGVEGSPIILYDYQETRAGENPMNFLREFKGYLQVDGYAGYHKVENVTLVGCWAHARRGFTDVLKSLPANSIKPVAATEGLQFCNQLFAIERKLKELVPEERYKQRLEQSKPIIDSFLSWLKIQEQNVLPKSGLGKAITYCLNQWDKLVAFLEDGRLEIDNNRSERAIKPVVIGRKAWLFSNTPNGARASAVIYSIVETAIANGLNPYYYLRYLFEQIPNIDLTDSENLDRLLPWSTTLPVSCISFKKLN